MPMFRLALIPLVTLLFAAQARAHAFFEHSSPRAGSEVSASPPEVTVTFTEAVEPQFSSIEVHNAQGSRVDTGVVHSASGNGRQLVVGLSKLPPGTYTVVWHVTSVDTRKTEGRFEFTIAP
jgi:methionine-rich copper-binding protein CopC